MVSSKNHPKEIPKERVEALGTYSRGLCGTVKRSSVSVWTPEQERERLDMMEGVLHIFGLRTGCMSCVVARQRQAFLRIVG